MQDEHPLRIRKCRPSSPVVDVMPGRPLGPEDAVLRGLKDESELTFNAQVIVVQHRDVYGL